MIGQFVHKLHQGVAPQRSMANGGGSGGGSSGTPYYAQQDRLFGTQADIAQNLYNQYAAMAPTFLANTTNMVDDAMDGTLANQMRQKAGNDAAAANANAFASTNRNMQRMGANFSTDRMLSEMNKSSIMGAANTAGTLNSATAAAEDMKWNRNAGAYGQISGMGTGAMAGMGSAGAGYGNMAAQSNANSMANAQGFGKFGSAIAGIGMGYADGGEVKKPGLHLASGAYVRQPFVNHLKPIDWRSMPTSSPGYPGTSTGDALGMMAMGMVPGLGLLAAKDLLRGDKSTLRGLYKDAKQWGTDQYDAYQQQKTVDAMNGSSGAEGYTFYSEPTADVASGADYTTATDGGAYSDASSLWDYTYANGGYIQKRGLHLADGGYAAPIDGSNFESDPNRFRAEPPSAEELYMMRLGNSAMAQGTNPMTYIKLANDYGKLSNASAAQDRLATAQANYDQTLNASQAAGTAGDSAQAVGTAVDTADAASSTADAADTINAATDLAEASNAADAASKAADGVGGGNPVGSVIKLGADLASGRDAGEAVADAALGYGGAELGATIGSAAGPVGTVVGGVLGGLLGGSIFKDGGAVGRRDYTPGGKVKGPGTETSDDVPAWLSDGEFVLNAQAVKLIGKDKLEALNQRGLAMRNQKPAKAPAKKGTGLKKPVKKAAGGVIKKKGC